MPVKVTVKSGFLPNEVEDELLRFANEVETATSAVIEADEAATHAKIAYDLAYARAVLSATGKNVEERKASATLMVEQEQFDSSVADLTLRTARRRLSELETKIEILRTFSANLRQMFATQSGP